MIDDQLEEIVEAAKMEGKALAMEQVAEWFKQNVDAMEPRAVSSMAAMLKRECSSVLTWVIIKRARRA